GNFLFQSICMDKNALLGVLVFDKAVTFGGVEKSYSAFPEKIFRIRSLLSGDADLDILCFNFVFLGVIWRCSGNIAISVYIDMHIFYAIAFILISSSFFLFFLLILYLFLSFLLFCLFVKPIL